MKKVYPGIDTIHRAVEHAAPEEFIRLMPGTYIITRSVEVKMRGVTIEAIGEDADAVTIRPLKGVIAFILNAPAAEVRRLRFDLSRGGKAAEIQGRIIGS